jgi:hypothetical protein
MKRRRRTFKYRWSADRKAASGVVVTLLILLVAVGALSMFMSVYVPIWGKDSESKQLKKIQSELLGMKESIDMQILAGKNSTVTTKLTLGDDGGPVFHLTRTVGGITVNTGTGLYMLRNATDANDVQGRAKGYIEYASSNKFFVDQKYIYENGAVLVEQGGRTVMKAGPHFDVRREPDGTYSAGITLISLNGITASRSGVGDIRIKTTLNVFDVTRYSGGDWTAGRSVSFNITTKHSDIWFTYINSTLARPENNLVPVTDYSVVTWSGGINATLKNLNRLDMGLAIVEVQLEL